MLRNKRFIPLTQEELDRGLTPEKRAELREALNVDGFLREGVRQGWLKLDGKHDEPAYEIAYPTPCTGGSRD